MEAEVYNKNGEKKGKVSLPESVFGVSWNSDLVHQVTVSMASNARAGTAQAKFRGEVRGGGRKPWRQKGTGRARHGSRRSPIWVGGGVTHGPRVEKDYDKKINKKMRAKALASVLSRKYKDGQIMFVDSYTVSEPKTKEAVDFLKSLSKVSGYEAIAFKNNASFIVIPENDTLVVKSFSNIGSVELGEVRNLNPLDVLNKKILIIIDPKRSIEVLKSRIGGADERNIKNVSDKKEESGKSKTKSTSKAKVVREVTSTNKK